MKPRPDDFERRRSHLNGLDDEGLRRRFWELADQVTRPLVELARTHTTPSIERSVLARLGVPSQEAKLVVEGCLTRGLLGHGAGHVVAKAAAADGLDPRRAAGELAAGRLWESVERSFNLDA